MQSSAECHQKLSGMIDTSDQIYLRLCPLFGFSMHKLHHKATTGFNILNLGPHSLFYLVALYLAIKYSIVEV